MGTLNAVTRKILETLKADAELGIPEANFYHGPPFMRNQTPFCYAVWNGGPVHVETFANEVWQHTWSIVIVDMAQEDNAALQSVMDKIERAKQVIAADPTLGGLVRNSQITSMEAETMTVGTDWGKISQLIAAARLVLRCEVTAKA
jgi:hypothetical protein